MRRRMPCPSALIVAATLALAACSGKQPVSSQEHLQNAQVAFADENFDVAIEEYKQFLDVDPFSEHAAEAELRIAQAYYRNEQYAEAIAALNDFQRMHPMSLHLPEVFYLLGRSYVDQMTTIDRDQAASENAHGWFQVVIDRYPNSAFAEKAREELAMCREALAEHELYVADYYAERGNLQATENRVKGILETYADTKAATTALEHLAEAYEESGDGKRAAMARAVAQRRSGTADPSEIRADMAARELLADLEQRYGPSERLTERGEARSLTDPDAVAPFPTGKAEE